MKDDTLKIILLIGGGIAAWWYLTNYGPNGAVSAGNVSYWDTWFGTAAATATSSTPTSADPNPGYDYWNGTAWVSTAGTSIAPTNPAPTTSTTSTTTTSGSTPTSVATCTAPMAPASSTGATALISAANGQTQLTADDWNYYWSQITGITQTTDLFPCNNRATLMSAQDYVNARAAAGLNTVPSAASESVSGNGVSTIQSPYISAHSGLSPAATSTFASTSLRGVGVGGIVPVNANRQQVGAQGMGMSFRGRGFSPKKDWRN
jgi:hypothetical protein